MKIIEMLAQQYRAVTDGSLSDNPQITFFNEEECQKAIVLSRKILCQTVRENAAAIKIQRKYLEYKYRVNGVIYNQANFHFNNILKVTSF